MSFTTRMKTELARNKKKSAILGVMCLVALYYWIPLMGKWFGGGETDAAEATQSEVPDFVVQKNSAANQIDTVESSAQPFLPWTTLVSLTNQDPMMTPAVLPSHTRSPFAEITPPQPEFEADPDDHEPETAAKPLVPESLDGFDLKLTNIFVGNRFRIASINGKTYRRGDVLSSNGYEFTVKEFHPRYVRLAIGERSYELYLDRLQLDGDNVVILNRPRGSD